jgi:hypothetical protein
MAIAVEYSMIGWTAMNLNPHLQVLKTYPDEEVDFKSGKATEI